MNDSVLIISGVIIGVGVILRQSLINKINEGFKNESYEKQKRWDLKQKMYFELLDLLFTYSMNGVIVNKLFKDENTGKELTQKEYEMLTNSLEIINTKIRELTQHIAIAPIILDKKTVSELDNLRIELGSIQDNNSADCYLEQSKLVTTTYKNLVVTAKNDLKIEVQN